MPIEWGAGRKWVLRRLRAAGVFPVMTNVFGRRIELHDDNTTEAKFLVSPHIHNRRETRSSNGSCPRDRVAGLTVAPKGVLSPPTKINQFPFSYLEAPMEARIETDARGRKTVQNACAQPCAIERGMRLQDGKWMGSILWHLKVGPVRFNDLARMIGGASKKMVSERLRQLEARGLVARRVIDGGPITVEYSTTPLGLTAPDCLDALRRWSQSLPDDLIAAVSDKPQPWPWPVSLRFRKRPC